MSLIYVLFAQALELLLFNESAYIINTKEKATEHKYKYVNPALLKSNDEVCIAYVLLFKILSKCIHTCVYVYVKIIEKRKQSRKSRKQLIANRKESGAINVSNSNSSAIEKSQQGAEEDMLKSKPSLDTSMQQGSSSLADEVLPPPQSNGTDPTTNSDNSIQKRLSGADHEGEMTIQCKRGEAKPSNAGRKPKLKKVKITVFLDLFLFN